MNGESKYAEMGRELGIESVDRLFGEVQAICVHVTREIALTNEGPLYALRAEYGLLINKRDILNAKLRNEPRPGEIGNRRRSVGYHGIIAALLVLAAIAFAIIAFAPFQLGAKGYAYSVGIGILAPFLLDKALKEWHVERAMKWIASGAAITALASLMLLAVIRGDIFMHELAMATQSVVIDGPSPAPPPSDDFYARDAALLRAVMVLLALSMEIAAGIALFEVNKVLAQSWEDWSELHRDLDRVQQRLLLLTEAIPTLQNTPQVFAENFWQTFYYAMLTRSKVNMMARFMVILFAVSLLPPHGNAAGNSTWVIAVDLSQSVGVKRADHDAAFGRNVEAVGRILSQAPAGSRVAVVGITENSFLQPDILVSAYIPEDPGYFGERLRTARAELMNCWRVRSSKLRPSARHTDILGAILLAEHLFEEYPAATERKLIVLSDMRQSTSTLDLESRTTVPDYTVWHATTHPPVAQLKRVEVYIIGAEDTRSSMIYWQSLKKFWSDYFDEARATLRIYSVLRDLPIPVSEILRSGDSLWARRCGSDFLDAGFLGDNVSSKAVKTSVTRTHGSLTQLSWRFGVA